MPVVPPLVEPPLVLPEPPVIPAAPAAPVFDVPEHGQDWTGQRPKQVR